jgi:hypothetical protein
MLSKLRSRYGLAGPAVAVALILAVTVAGIPAVAQPIATSSASIAKMVQQALSLGKTANKRSAAALKIAQEAQKQAGPQGPKGDTGPQGPKGDAGLQGSPGVSGLERVVNQTQVDSSDAKELVVACPAGKKVLGGGAHLQGLPDLNNQNPLPDIVFESIAISSSFPSGDGEWFARAHEHTDTDEPWSLTVFAICASVS